MKNTASLIDNAASSAFGKIDTYMGNDVDLDLYNRLDDRGFQALTEVYGAGEVSKYIKTMEYKRMKQGGSDAKPISL